MNKMQLVGKVV